MSYLNFRREKEGLLHIFEKSDTNPKKADPLKIIKSFNRSAAGQQLNKLSDLRPPEILRKTIEYMVYKYACHISKYLIYIAVLNVTI